MAVRHACLHGTTEQTMSSIMLVFLREIISAEQSNEPFTDPSEEPSEEQVSLREIMSAEQSKEPFTDQSEEPSEEQASPSSTGGLPLVRVPPPSLAEGFEGDLEEFGGWRNLEPAKCDHCALPSLRLTLCYCCSGNACNMCMGHDEMCRSCHSMFPVHSPGKASMFKPQDPSTCNMHGSIAPPQAEGAPQQMQAMEPNSSVGAQDTGDDQQCWDADEWWNINSGVLAEKIDTKTAEPTNETQTQPHGQEPAPNTTTYRLLDEDMTTLCICNIPRQLTRDVKEVVALINAQGFKDTYDIVYVPLAKANKRAFVNFIHPKYAMMFNKVFKDYQFRQESGKLGYTLPAHHQGYDACIEQCVRDRPGSWTACNKRGRPVMHAARSATCSQTMWLAC